jgi:hypothetical protein
MKTLSFEMIEMLRELRENGWVVCLFTPDEVAESDPEDIEYAMCEAGWSKINLEKSC